MEQVDLLLEFLEEEFKDSLRSVGYYSVDDTGFVFVRDDVESEYETGDIDRVFREAQLEALDHDYQESLYEHGGLQATIRIFEQATEFHFAVSPTEGIVAAVDAGEVDGARELVVSAIESIEQ